MRTCQVSDLRDPISVHIENYDVETHDNVVRFVNKDTNNMVFSAKFDHRIQKTKVSKDSRFLWVMENDT